jgi:hypothetical protein
MASMTEKRTNLISVRLTDSENEMLAKLAFLDGLPEATFVRRVLLREMKAIAKAHDKAAFEATGKRFFRGE